MRNVHVVTSNIIPYNFYLDILVKMNVKQFFK